MYDTAIIGGGAAGLAAAIFAAERGKSAILLERLPRVGKKILATGNGRCNISNRHIAPERYHGKHKGFSKYALSLFSASDTEAFFARIGLPLIEGENGKLYPQSLQAASVLDLLRLAAKKCGAIERTDAEVTKITPYGTYFDVLLADKTVIKAKTVICAAGGKAAPSMGTDGTAYKLLTDLGHTLVRPFPSLVQIKTAAPMRALKGTKHQGSATIYLGTKPMRTETGEILFTDYGVSGPPIFNLSRIASQHAGEKDVTLSINFFPSLSEKELSEMIHARRALCPHLTGESFLYGLLQKNIGREVIKRAKSDADIVQLLHDFRLSVLGVMPWANAQVTAGGIDTADVCPETMESYLVPGLYLCGEILDVDGDCGGFNLQWAWSSAHRAAQEI